MASIKVWTSFRETPRPDDLCPLCFNPSLKVYTLQQIDLDGITPLATRNGCRDCGKFVAPAVPIPQETTK